MTASLVELGALAAMVAIVALVDNFNPWIVLSLNVVKGDDKPMVLP